MKRAVELATDDNYKAYVDALGVLFLGVFTWGASQIAHVFEGTTVAFWANVATIMGFAGTGLRTIWVFFDWRERRARIAIEKQIRAEEEEARQKELARGKRLEKNLEDLLYAPTADEIAEILERNAKEKRE